MQFYLQKMKTPQGTTQTLTHGINMWQSTFEVNGQRPNRTSKTNCTGIYKTGGQIYELNYKRTKIEIRVKLENQKCNFTYKK